MMGDRYIAYCPNCNQTGPPSDWPEDQPWYPANQLYFAEFTNWESTCAQCGRLYRMDHEIKEVKA